MTDMGQSERWMVYGYVVGEVPPREAHHRTLAGAIWRWLRWRVGLTNWDVLHLPQHTRRGPSDA